MQDDKRTAFIMSNASKLPKWVREATNIVGLAAVEKIVGQYGGTRIYFPIPKNLKAEHPLCQLIGEDAARALSDEFGGLDHFDVPRTLCLDLMARDRQILEDKEAGESQANLARRYRLTERSIRNIYRKYGV